MNNYWVPGNYDLKDMQEQYTALGRESRIIDGRLCVFAKVQPKVTKKDEPESEPRLKSKREREHGTARS